MERADISEESDNVTSHNFSWIMIVANPGSSLYLGTNKAMKRDTKCIDLIGSGLFQDMSKLERMRVGRLLIIPLPASGNQPLLAFVMSGDNSYLGHMAFPILNTCDDPDGNPFGSAPAKAFTSTKPSPPGQ